MIDKDNLYKKIENVLSNDEVELLKRYCIIKHKTNRDNFDIIQNNNGDTCFYNDAIMTSLLEQKRPLIEKHCNKKLWPTYAFWRMYSKYATLKPHTDRPSCEISVTINLGNSGEKWPIFMDGNGIDINPGEGVIYMGCKIKHWREEFKGDWSAQVFMHYVDQEGPYSNHKWDKKIFLGSDR